MVERNSGTIVNMISATAYQDPPARIGNGGWGMGYAMSKAALARVAPLLHRELEDYDIRLFSVDPGFVVTEKTEAVGRAAQFSQHYKPATPPVIGAAIRWLVRPATSSRNSRRSWRRPRDLVSGDVSARTCAERRRRSRAASSGVIEALFTESSATESMGFRSLSLPVGRVEHVFVHVVERVEAGDLGEWPDADLIAAVRSVEAARGRLAAAQSLLLAELVGRGRAPEAHVGNTMSGRAAQRRTKTAIALGDGSLPGAAAALATGEVSFEH